MNREHIAKLDKLHERYCQLIGDAERKEECSSSNEPRNEKEIRVLRNKAEEAWRKYEAFLSYLKKANLYE